MAAITIKLISNFTVAVNGVYVMNGSTAPTSITAASGLVFDRTLTIANGATAVLWDAAAATNVTDFDFLWITSDQNIQIELNTDQNNSIGDEFGTVTVGPNAPLVLASDDSYANYTANFATGTLDVIDRIRAKNSSGSTANVHIFLAT